MTGGDVPRLSDKASRLWAALRAALGVRIERDQPSQARLPPDTGPILPTPLDYLREGDQLVVWRLDRLGRSLPHLLDVLAQLDGRGVGFRSLTEALDTSTSGGRLVFSVFGAIAQFERELITERTRAGLAAAKAQGRVGGRPRTMTDANVAFARDQRTHGASWNDIAASLRLSRSTVQRAITS